jgi:hypothetical protein
MPEKTSQEIKVEAKVEQAKVAKIAKKAREQAVEKKEQEQELEVQQNQLRYNSVKREVEKQVEAVVLAKAAVKKTTSEMNKEIEEKSKARELAAKQDKVQEKSVVLRSVVEEAEANVQEALRFVQAVSNGNGDEAYRQSFLYAEHRAHGDGSPGGPARLQGAQLNMPWLVKLNHALSKAKETTDYKNMLAVQGLLDKADTRVSNLERRWKTEEAHRASVTEALKKDGVKREIAKKDAIAREVVPKKQAELEAKENKRKAALAKLKSQTASLKEQANELEEKSYMAADPNFKNQPNELAEQRGEDISPANKARAQQLMQEAQNSKMKAARYAQKENASKQAMKEAGDRLKALEAQGNKPM